MDHPKLNIPFDKSLPRSIKFNPENKKKYDAREMVPYIAQHVGVQLENEGGALIERSQVNFNQLVCQISEFSSKELHFLNTIDLYGDTVFNVHQAPVVIEELKKLADMIDDAGLLSDIAETVRILEKCEQHLYVRFIGD